MRKHWTAQEDELARTLFKQRARPEMFIALLGRDKRAAGCRLHRLDAEMGKFKAADLYISRVAVPDSVIEDRNRRLLARYQMDLTGIICGDPPVGFSALERRI